MQIINILLRPRTSWPEPKRGPGEQNSGPLKSSSGWWGIALAAGYGLFELYRSWDQVRTGSLHAIKYEELQPGQIRLLVLNPGRGDQPIECHLQHTSLADAPDFEALSYVWGAPEPAFEIMCNDEKTRIGPNLHLALHHLRDGDRPRVLWADALCINQRDVGEKNQQVPMMGDIYQKATRAVIWLGVPDTTTENSMQALREVNDYFRRTLWLYDGTFVTMFTRMFWFAKLGLRRTLKKHQIAELAAFDWASIVALYENIWFRRVWVFQEFAKSQDAVVVFGQVETSLASVLNPYVEVHFTQNIREEVLGPHNYDWQSLHSIYDLMIMGYDRNRYILSPRTLVDLMFENRARNATDDRDYVFAFRNLASDVSEADMETAPDYSVPTGEIYQRLALWSLKKKDLQILQYASLNWKSSRTDRALPSWVPDWRTMRWTFPILSDPKRPYNASGSKAPVVSWDPGEPDVLRIKGHLVDRVSDVAITECHFIDMEEFRTWEDAENQKLAKRLRLKNPQDERVSSWLEVQKARDEYENGKMDHPLVQRWIEAQAFQQKYGMGLDKFEILWMRDCRRVAARGTQRLTKAQAQAWWRTLSLGQPQRFSFEEFLEYHAFMIKAIREHRKFAPLEGTAHFVRTDLEIREWELRRQMSKAFAGLTARRFLATAHGRLGWAPLCTKPGDLVCIFDGAPVPFILRPRTEKMTASQKQSRDNAFSMLGDETKYELVGEAYIDGMMYGEAVSAKDSGRVFHLT
ncbi:hypothetical protein QQX98_008310 [Neonectria punicea]|uniref:Heterokaryon incompatibility domain-containing protein n=1 Tax=Neonectria punicea TaxID=979145 RepID=A0ABR1GVZ4_9HYPO